MDRIRVALGEVQSTMSRDILAHITRLEQDIEFVGEVSHDNLKSELVRLRADVLICEIQPDELPAVSRAMFDEPGAPVVVGLAREGREAAVCVPNAGAAQLMSLIRAAVRGVDASGKVLEMVRTSETGAALPYSSLWECVNDQLRVLDLALLAEVDAFEATTWEEGVQRLQGLAISPDEVRALLLKGSGPAATQIDEFRRRRQRLLSAVSQRIAATIDRPDAPPYVRLIERFHLDPFEQFCITATLAVEIDRNKYGKAYALLQDDITRKQPSVELLLRLNDGQSQSDRWQASGAFDSAAPLRRWNLLRFVPRESGDPATAFGRRVELDDRIGRFLLGLSDLGPQLEEIATTDSWEPIARPIDAPAAVQDRLRALVTESGTATGTPGVVVHVHGPYGTGRRSLIAGVCRQRGLRLIRVDANRLVALPPTVLHETLQLIAREPLLEPAAVCLENVDAVLADDGVAASALATAVETVHKTAVVLFILSHRTWLPEALLRGAASCRIGFGLPSTAEAAQIWSSELADQALDPRAGSVERVSTELASRFALSPGQIRDAVAAARLRSQWDGTGNRLTLADLYQGCRDQCSHRLATLARHVTRAAGWPELIVPTTQTNQLRELEAAIRNASGVLEDWNFASRLPYGRGITALFSGPSGTGKTMAAGILAAELGLDLYQIDLSRVVSKYIGETEKNLDRIFDEAKASNAILFFDEADALFGKRSAIKDAHDRYANIEVAYLLQKMEEREGITILATNLRANIDDAFMRRIRFVIEFPMPEYQQRLQIWRGALPKQARLASDVDLQSLAKRYPLSGGSIVNVCLAAASLAYAPDGAIAMKHLLHATKRELQKLGEQYREEEFSPESAIASSGVVRSGA